MGEGSKAREKNQLNSEIGNGPREKTNERAKQNATKWETGLSNVENTAAKGIKRSADDERDLPIAAEEENSVNSGRPKLTSMSTEDSEIKEMAAMIVRDYLSGHWKTANSSNVVVQKMSGGLSNWLYQITLSSFQSQTESSDPKTVLLRFHGPIYGKSAFEHIVTDSLIFMLMSERSLGPKLHGVFPGGRIEEYIHARSLKASELHDPEISSAISNKMAHIHTLQVPISKNANSLFDLMSKWLVELQTEWDQYKPNDAELQKLTEKFKSYDIASEVKWLRHYLTNLNSPVVFCHNDLNEGNILITYDSINSDKPNLVLIDYEYSSYNYRGFEFANHFLEYTLYMVKEYPYFKVDQSAYPSVEQQVKFIRNYLRTYHDIVRNSNGFQGPKNNLNLGLNGESPAAEGEITEEEAQLLMEISNFRLLSHLFWGVWAATHSQSGIEFGYWDYCIARLEAYFETKEKILLQEIPRVKKKS